MKFIIWLHRLYASWKKDTRRKQYLDHKKAQYQLAQVLGLHRVRTVIFGRQAVGIYINKEGTQRYVAHRFGFVLYERYSLALANVELRAEICALRTTLKNLQAENEHLTFELDTTHETIANHARSLDISFEKTEEMGSQINQLENKLKEFAITMPKPLSSSESLLLSILNKKLPPIEKRRLVLECIEQGKITLN